MGVRWTAPAALTFVALLTASDVNGQLLFEPRFQRPDIEIEIPDGHLTDVVIADFDGDGAEDVACALGRYLSLLRNAGDGRLETPSLVVEGEELCAVCAADFDADGLNDIASVDSARGLVVILRNMGAGRFDEASVAVGEEPRSVVAADVDGDGDIDLIALNTVSDSVSTLINDGAGGFGDVVTSPVPFNVVEKAIDADYPGPHMASGDFNNDGTPDLAIPLGTLGVLTMLGDGLGGFTEGPDHPGMVGYDIVAADFDVDGNVDLASINAGPNSAVTVSLGHGNGTWPASPTIYSADHLSCETCLYFFTTLAAGDVDADGDVDLLFGSELQKNIGVLENSGDGTFLAATSIPSVRRSWVVTSGDLTGDGVVDLLIGSDWIRSGVHSYPGRIGGTPLSATPVSKPSEVRYRSIAGADLDLDGDVDVIGVSNDEDVIEILASSGDGTFEPTAP